MRRALTYIRCTVFVTIVASSTNSFAQDACIALLQHGIYDTHAAQSATQSYATFRSTFCSWYSSYRSRNQAATASVTIPIVDIPIGFSGGMTYGQADAMSQALCNAQASTSSLDQAWSTIDRTLNPGGTQAFVACVKALRGGLDIDYRLNDDETLLSVGLSYDAPTRGIGRRNDHEYFHGWLDL